MTSKSNTKASTPQLRMIAIDKISVRPDFNPRRSRDAERFAETVHSVAKNGVLQSVLVTPTEPDADTYYVVAGEGRFLAAQEAGDAEVPCNVTTVDDATQGLELAMAENMVRDELDPVSVAHGFAKLMRQGWSRQKVARYFKRQQKFVAERLLIVDLPDELYPRIVDGSVPLSAIRTLSDLAGAHPGLPLVLAARVLDCEPVSWAERPTWNEAIADPVEALTFECEGADAQLPEDVFPTDQTYVLADLALTDEGRSELQWICEVRGQDASKATGIFSDAAIDQAIALGAAYPKTSDHVHLIVGADYAGQVMSDSLRASAQAIRDEQAAAEARISAANESRESDGADGVGDDRSTDEQDREKERREAEEAEREAARAEREAAKEARRLATIHNDELGVAVTRNLARVKMDPATLRLLLLSVPFDDLARMAMRGARYGLPGWEQREDQANGKTKRVYLGYSDCEAKAREYLDGATTVGQIAGRVLSLLAMARYADEVAVAESYRSRWVPRRLSEAPWGGDVVDLVDELCEGRLPEHLTAPARQRRADELREAAEFEAAVKAAEARLEAVDGPLDRLGSDELRQLSADARLALSYTEEWKWTDEIRRILDDREVAETQADTEPAAAEQVAA